MNLLGDEGLRGNLGKKYWEERFSFGEQRKALHDYRIWQQEDFNFHNMEILGGRLYWEEYVYLFIHKKEGFIRNLKGETVEERKKERKLLGEIAKDICINRVIKNRGERKWAL
ncbi:hypothetical protein O181_040253 [Austropuccinia psidii MF-1]|uniref:Uncharacterized protein n=1 Tax=Austropuccinia psidii MF-1 TaxID=1389203 RepID=A0A9Q3DEZ9_9BASI|nr:hypothetical protein [Austropuccinia psidii MF-1]